MSVSGLYDYVYVSLYVVVVSCCMLLSQYCVCMIIVVDYMFVCPYLCVFVVLYLICLSVLYGSSQVDNPIVGIDVEIV